MMFPLLTLLASPSAETSGDQRAVVRPEPREHEHRVDTSPWAGWWCPDCA